jgi:WD40 repeat protein
MFQLNKLKSLRVALEQHPPRKGPVWWGKLLGMMVILAAAFQYQVLPVDPIKNASIAGVPLFTLSELAGTTSRFVSAAKGGNTGPKPVISQDGVDVKQLASWGRDTAYAVAFAPDGKSLAVGSSVGIYIYDTQDLSQTNLLATGVRVRGLAFSPDGAIIAGGLFDDSVRLWRVVDGQLLRTLKGHTDWVRAVAISPDGAYLASASDDDTMRLWRLSDGALVRTIQAGT